MIKNIKNYLTSAISMCASLASLSLTQVYASGTNPALDSLTGTVGSVSTIIGTLSNIVLALIFIVFFISLISFIKADADAKEKNKMQLIWASVAMFVAMSIWGIIAWFGEVTGIDTEKQGASSFVIPGLGGSGGGNSNTPRPEPPPGHLQ